MSEVAREKPLNVKVEEATFKVQLKAPPRKSMLITKSSSTRSPRKTVGSKEMSADAVAAPMTGRILSIYVEKGAQVKENQKLCILEAMKMENEIVAPKKGIVQEVCVSEGSPVNEGDALFIIR
jgi:biotin carboxyl carrier protein